MQNKAMQEPPVSGNHPSQEDLVKLFNTVLVSTKVSSIEKNYDSLQILLKSPAFLSVLTCIQSLASSQDITIEAATEQVITTFRKIDEIWGSYLVREGLEKLKTPQLFKTNSQRI